MTHNDMETRKDIDEDSGEYQLSITNKQQTIKMNLNL